jgi:predicted aspartyl protease
MILKYVLLLFCFSLSLVRAEDLKDLQQRFLQSHQTPKQAGMEWDATTSPVSPDWSTISDKTSVEIPLTGPKGFRFLLIDVVIGDEKILALIDTGAGTSLLSMEAAVRSGAHPVGPELLKERILGFAGPSYTILTRIPLLKMGDLEIKHVRAGVFPQQADLPVLKEVNGRKVEMIIGYDLLKRLSWIEFFQGKEMIRIGAGVAAPDMQGVRQPLLPGKNHGPKVEVTVNGSQPFPVTLDTGGQFGLRLPQSLADTLGVEALVPGQVPQERMAGTGKSATIKGQKVTLAIGSLQMQKLPTYLHVGDPRVADAIGPLIGNPVLSRVHWALDHEKKQVIFYP